MLIKAHEKHGFDAARLNRLDTFLKEQYIDIRKLPHARLLVSRDGEIVHFSSQGAAREGSDRPIDEGSLVHAKWRQVRVNLTPVAAQDPLKPV